MFFVADSGTATVHSSHDIVATPGAPELASSEEILPESCGPVGVQGYSPPPAATVPPFTLSRGEVIVVNTTDDIVNGNTTNVSDLLKDPGPDGISLREAVLATDNSLGQYTIDFSQNLTDATIQLGGPLFLTKGNLTINGSIDGSGKPEVTINDTGGTPFIVESSENTLYGLRITGDSPDGVLLTPPSPADETYVGNVVDDLTIEGGMGAGIDLDTWSVSGTTGERWVNTLIAGNHIDVNPDDSGIGINVVTDRASGAYLYGTLILNNTVVTASSPFGAASGIVVQSYPLGSTGNEIVNTLIANNEVYSGGDSTNVGIYAAENGGFRDLFEGLRIVNNSIFPGFPDGPSNGVSIFAGIDFTNSSLPSKNTFENVSIMGNTVVGPSDLGIDAAAAYQVNASERNVTIEGNAIDLFASGSSVVGVRLLSGSNIDSLIHNNTLGNITVRWNTIAVEGLAGQFFSAGVMVAGGQFGATQNLLDDTSVSNNLIEPTNAIGINVFGGANGASDNTVSALNLTCNEITENPGVVSGVNFTGISVVGGFGIGSNNTTANTVNHVLICDDLLAGVIDNATVANDVGTPAIANSVSVTYCGTQTPPESASPSIFGLPWWVAVLVGAVITLVMIGVVIGLMRHRRPPRAAISPPPPSSP
jgi:hypothetical protein